MDSVSQGSGSVLKEKNRLFSLIQEPHLKRRFQQFFYCCMCICYRGNVSTEPLPSNDSGIFTKPLPSNDRGIGAVIYVPSFIKIFSGVQKLLGGIHRHTNRQKRDLISLLNFSKMRKVG
jgi:hypothetical protein